MCKGGIIREAMYFYSRLATVLVTFLVGATKYLKRELSGRYILAVPEDIVHHCSRSVRPQSSHFGR